MAIHPRNESRVLLLIIAGSLIGNVALWYGLSRGATPAAMTAPLPELVVEREPLEKRASREPPKVVPKPDPPKLVRAIPVQPKKVSSKAEAKPPPVPGAHNKVILAKAPPGATKSSAFTAPADGKAKLGAPTSGQNPGSGTVNPPHPQPISTPAPTPIVLAPPTPPPPAPTRPETPPAPPPVAAPPKKEDAPPPPPPKAKGPSQEAVATHQVNPEIPESLKSQTFKSHVRVKVDIASDGSFAVTLRTSSGNTDIDKLVLDALNKWKWKPALKDGQAVDSVQLFRFDFSVE